MLVTYFATFFKIICMLLKIKEIRTSKNISQEVLAAKTGLSKRMIIDYEKENTDIQVKKLQLIATALEVDFFDMFNIPKTYFVKEEKNTLNEPRENYQKENIAINILKDYNEHLKKEVEGLKDDKELLKNIINDKLGKEKIA